MTSHELARLLLAGPDLPVLIPVNDQDGGGSPPNEPYVDWALEPEEDLWVWSSGGGAVIVLEPQDWK